MDMKIQVTGSIARQERAATPVYALRQTLVYNRLIRNSITPA